MLLLELKMISDYARWLRLEHAVKIIGWNVEKSQKTALQRLQGQ